MANPSCSDSPSPATLCVTAFRGSNPEKMRVEISRAIEVHGGTTTSSAEGEVIANFGASKRQYDHALRALRAACDQLAFAENLRIAHGASVHCATAVGARTEFGALAILSRLGDGLVSFVTQALVDAALENLPNLWDVVHTREAEVFPVPAGLQPAPTALHGQSVLVGAHVRAVPELAAFRFRCVGTLPLESGRPAVIVYAVDRPAQLQAEEVAELSSRPEQRLGHYQLIEIVGRGACAEVWKAYDERGQLLALKRLRHGSTGTEQERRRFQREGEILLRLQHPQICRLHELGTVDGTPFIAMEFIEGVTLAEIIAAVRGLSTATDAGIRFEADLSTLITQIGRDRTQPASDFSEPPTVMRAGVLASGRTLPIPQTLRLVRRICAGVEYAHAQGVLHRDLKPSNILVRPDGEPIITDFGLGKLYLPGNTSLSAADQILGTLEYMAPEQARSSRDIDERADVYALGAMLYQMLTGRKPFLTSGHLLHDAQRLQTHEPIPPAELGMQLNRTLEAIVLRALRNRAAERFGSVAELRTTLERYERGEQVAAEAPRLLASLRARLDEHRRRAVRFARRLRRRV